MAGRAGARRKLPGDQPAAIAQRGESELTLEGVTYRLRPSRAAVSAIEKKTGQSLLDLVRLGNTGSLTVEHLGIVAAELIKAGAQDDATRHVGAETIADLIYEEGVSVAVPAITMCLLGAATGGRTVSGELRAPTA